MTIVTVRKGRADATAGSRPPMTDANSRRGLTENALGQMVCPVCRETRVSLIFLTYGSSGATVHASMHLAKVTYGRNGGEQFLAVMFKCRQGHEFAVELVYDEDADDVDVGTVVFMTKWQREGRGNEQ